MHQLKVRLEVHEKQVHDEAVRLLSTGTFPNVLYTACKRVNMAIMCLMHASVMSRERKLQYLPAPRQVPQDIQLSGDAPQIGEVWWLFDADQPYLAEVFCDGAVPDNRLPHLDRSALKGAHVARVLGSSRQHVKVLRKGASMCLYTAWCAPHSPHATLTFKHAVQSSICLVHPSSDEKAL